MPLSSISWFFLVIDCFAMIPIEWSTEGLPLVSILVNNRTEFRYIDTKNSEMFAFFDQAIMNGSQSLARINLHPTEFQFDELCTACNTPFVGRFSISPDSVFANHDEIDWFTINPRGFYPFPLENMRTNPGQFCLNPNEAVILPSQVAPIWLAHLKSDSVVLIDSMSPFIHLTNDVYTSFMSEVAERLNEFDYQFTINNNTGETTIHRCNISALDNILPEIEFNLAYPRPNSRERWFVRDALPHFVSFSAKQYMHASGSDHCNLGIVVSTDEVHRIGAALFRSYSVSFSRSRLSMIICQAANPLILGEL